MGDERGLRICFRSGATIDGTVADAQTADRLLRVLGEHVEGWLFGENPKVLLEFSNGPVLVDRREIESAQALTHRPAPVQADGGAHGSEPGGGAALNQKEVPPNVSEVG